MTKATGAPTLLTIPATARRLGVSRDTVYRLINSKAIRTVSVPGSKTATFLRIREDDLAAFIEAHTASVDTPTVADAFAASS